MIEQTDLKYTQSKPCVICGEPTRTIAIRCKPCLDKIYLRDELSFAREAVRENPQRRVEYAHDKQGIVHLVLLRTRNMGWCGGAISQIAATRGKITPWAFWKSGEVLELPEYKIKMKLCRACQARVREMYDAQRSAARGERRPVPTVEDRTD